MKESMDESQVPDMGQAQKRKLQSESHSVLSPKRILLDVSCSASSDITISSEKEILEEASFNEPSLSSSEDVFFSFEENNNKRETTSDSISVLNGDSFTKENHDYSASSVAHTEQSVFVQDYVGFLQTQPSNGPVQTSAVGVTESLEDKTGLNSFTSIVRDAKVISEILPDKEFTEIYQMLLEQRDCKTRLDSVTLRLTQTDDSTQDNVPPMGIFEAKRLAHAIPSVSGNGVDQFSTDNRTIDNFMTPVTASVQETSSDHSLNSPAELVTPLAPNDLVFENDPLLGDMRTIAKMFPAKDRNEIYALLEANFKSLNRVQIVINEILQVDSGTPSGSQQSQPQQDAISKSNTTSLAEGNFPFCSYFS
jgi:hypothetical protein